MATKSVTVTVSHDTSYLGDAATSEDLERWATNICLAIEEEFGVSVIQIVGTTDRLTDCDDPEIRAWLREISATDQWMRYL